ncbi:MAG: oxidoreductase, partial [Rhodopirellula bahusiensis]
MNKKRLGVFKFASCDGCQLSLLSCEDELIELAGKIEIAHFLEASSRVDPGPFDVALIEGSITTALDA